MIVPSLEDFKPFAKFKVSDFERWLRIGLEGYLLEGEGVWAFEPLGVFIGQEDHLVLDLRNIYRAFPSRKQACIRQAVANLLASLEPIERNIIIFEHLLSLASVFPAGVEVLRVLPARIGNGFFGLTENREGKSLFDLTLMTVVELAVPTKDAVDCLHALVSSRYFENAYAGIALTALCRADDRNLASHMAKLREPLAAMFQEFNTDDATKRRLAAKILDAVGLERLVHALPELVLSDRPYRNLVNDNWFLAALLKKNENFGPLLQFLEDQQDKIYFYRTDKPEHKVQLSKDTRPAASIVYKSKPDVSIEKPYFKKITKETNKCFKKIFGSYLSASLSI